MTDCAGGGREGCKDGPCELHFAWLTVDGERVREPIWGSGCARSVSVLGPLTLRACGWRWLQAAR